MTFPPISAVYLAVQEARVSGVLGAAWDATPIEMICPYFESMTLSMTYIRGGAGGAFDLQIETSPYSIAANVPPGADEWITESIYAGGMIAAGIDTQSRLQRNFQTYQAVGAGAESFTYGPIPLDATIERIRIVARESGNVGAPGALQIEAVFA